MIDHTSPIPSLPTLDHATIQRLYRDYGSVESGLRAQPRVSAEIALACALDEIDALWDIIKFMMEEKAKSAPPAEETPIMRAIRVHERRDRR